MKEQNKTKEIFVGSLKNDFYSDVTVLLDELNAVVREGLIKFDKRFNTGQTPRVKSFTIAAKDSKIVTFTKPASLVISVTPFVCKLLGLTGTTTTWICVLNSTHTGKQDVLLAKFNRSHFYVHADCLERRFMSQHTSDLLRTVVNSAEDDVRHTVDIVDLQYHRVARRHLGTINMYITDQMFSGFLKFHNEITYLLHFRKCQLL